MHFHLPKPLHGWRELAGEVGIIVLGVLIALGAEQLIENWHWKQRVREAEASMTKELGEDDGAQAAARRAISPCIERRLDAAEQALIAERDHAVPFVAPKLATPPFRTWDSSAWHAAVSSDATSHMATERMYDWSAPYSLAADMDQASVREFNDWAELSRIDTLPPHPSEAERERMFEAIAHARQDNAFLSWISGVFLRFLKPLDIEVPEAAKRKEIVSQRQQIGC